ncbi:MAG: hypothetical protein LBH79_10065 [Nitrososphaerota archaeon]|nr:hypothetical protein [Nitrososphaerota archaeon]
MNQDDRNLAYFVICMYAATAFTMGAWIVLGNTNYAPGYGDILVIVLLCGIAGYFLGLVYDMIANICTGV